MERLMGLDLAESTGFAFGNRTERPYFGVFQLPGFASVDKQVASMASLYTAVHSMVAANKIEGVAIEAPLMGITKKNKRGIPVPVSHHGTKMLVMLSGVAQAAAKNGGAKIVWLPEVSSWRKAVLGNGFPSDPKGAALQYCRLVLKLKVEDHNAAEGLCVWCWAHGQAKLL